jgi:hypothetical protein
MATPPPTTDDRMSADDVARALEAHMDSIMQLLEAMVAEEAGCDMKLAALLESEREQVRIAIIDKLRALLRGLAAEKEKELDQFLEPEKRAQVERQRNVIMQWLTWLMSEETLRKIREAFLASPPMERQLHDIGQALANFGVQQKLREQMQDKKLVSALTNPPPPPLPQATPPDRDKDKGTGRG